jgi:GT2 family glycosyltransferase
MIANKKNIGFGAGNNIAIRKAKGEYILILNPDVAVLAEEITKLYTFIKENESIALVGPRLLNPDGSVQLSCFRFPTVFTPLYRRTFLKRVPKLKAKYDHYRMLNFDHNKTIPVHWLVGGCMLFKKDAFMSVGMFDERYFMYYEDIDLCRSLWEKGFKVYYHPKSEMVHYHQRLSAEEGFIKSFSNKTLYYHLLSWIKYVQKYFGKTSIKIEKFD